jgi:hypothetical protein
MCKCYDWQLKFKMVCCYLFFIKYLRNFVRGEWFFLETKCTILSLACLIYLTMFYNSMFNEYFS